jgi:hypothetical protein
MKPTNTICGQKTELLDVKTDGTYNNHRAFKRIETHRQAVWKVRKYC